ncbi:hypothetical protein [Bacillus cereus]|nr:hypothetical protein [Bacillus cereus]MDR4987104.1 hypothetical protein [Bacillus cereus]MEA1012674.1 hypothetical protein [Bacillus cereus]
MSVITKSDILNIVDSYYSYEESMDNLLVKVLQPNERLLSLKESVHKNGLDQVWYTEFQRLYSNNAVVNWTDFPHSQCLEYKILAHSNQEILDDNIELITLLGGKRVDLRIFISLLGDYYYCMLEACSHIDGTDGWDFRDVSDSGKYDGLLEDTKIFMNKKGFTYIPKELLNTKLEGIETGYISCNELTLFNCLFSEFESID